MINKQALWLATGFVLVALVACTPVIVPVTPQTPNEQATPYATQTPDATQMPDATPQLSVDTTMPITREESVTIDTSAPNPQVLHAMKDLAARTAVALDEIELVGFEAVVWPDKGLGCPQPGMVYQQVQQDGLLIHLRAGGVLYEYHSGEGRPPFLCENSTPAKPARTKLTPETPDTSK